MSFNSVKQSIPACFWLWQYKFFPAQQIWSTAYFLTQVFITVLHKFDLKLSYL
jgi:hypothetical protein